MFGVTKRSRKWVVIVTWHLFLKYFLRRLTGDWGHFRVPLHPAKNTKTFGRGGFFIHGGEYPGSAGCVDVGKYDSMLFNGFNGLSYHNEIIVLEVEYE